MLIIETIVLCCALFMACVLGSGTDKKNLRHYASYPDVVQMHIRELECYQGQFKEVAILPHWIANLFLFAALFFLLVLPLRQGQFVDNFVALLFLGETVNVFDLVVIDLLWWRNTQRIRLSALPQKQLYQNPQKHIEAFFRAAVMFVLVALLDGYLLSLF